MPTDEIAVPITVVIFVISVPITVVVIEAQNLGNRHPRRNYYCNYYYYYYCNEHTRTC